MASKGLLYGGQGARRGLRYVARIMLYGVLYGESLNYDVVRKRLMPLIQLSTHFLTRREGEGGENSKIIGTLSKRRESHISYSS